MPAGLITDPRRFTARFEREFAKVFGLRHAMLVNSGSSADLVALSCLTSPVLGERQYAQAIRCVQRQPGSQRR